MEGFGRWDLVVWILAAYIAIMALVRMMLHALNAVNRRSRNRSRELDDRPSVPQTSQRDAA